MDTITADMMKVNLLAIGAVFIVLLFTMKSLILPIILVLTIETAIWLFLMLVVIRFSILHILLSVPSSWVPL